MAARGSGVDSQLYETLGVSRTASDSEIKRVNSLVNYGTFVYADFDKLVLTPVFF